MCLGLGHFNVDYFFRGTLAELDGHVERQKSRLLLLKVKLPHASSYLVDLVPTAV